MATSSTRFHVSPPTVPPSSVHIPYSRRHTYAIVLLILCYTDFHSSLAISITFLYTLFTVSLFLHFTCFFFPQISIVFCDHVELREHQGLSCPEDRGGQANGSAESWRGSAGNQGKMPSSYLSSTTVIGEIFGHNRLRS